MDVECIYGHDSYWGRMIAPLLKGVPLKKGYSHNCYVACEAVYHVLRESEHTNINPGALPRPATLKLPDGIVHWFLYFHHIQAVLDVTDDQFDFRPDYTQGRCRGFLTKEPSKRAQLIIPILSILVSPYFPKRDPINSEGYIP